MPWFVVTKLEICSELLRPPLTCEISEASLWNWKVLNPEVPHAIYIVTRSSLSVSTVKHVMCWVSPNTWTNLGIGRDWECKRSSIFQTAKATELFEVPPPTVTKKVPD